MRLFIASPVIIEDYETIQKSFEGIIEGKWIAEQNLHLTWVFLGEMEDAAPIIEKFSQITPMESEIAIESLGYFGRPPRILYAKADSTLLYEKARECKEAGFSLYRFKPHVTLCRIRQIDDYKAYKEQVKAYKEKTLGKVLPQIHLYKSELKESGAEYTKLL